MGWVNPWHNSAFRLISRTIAVGQLTKRCSASLREQPSGSSFRTWMRLSKDIIARIRRKGPHLRQAESLVPALF